jgi:hypothetical protein
MVQIRLSTTGKLQHGGASARRGILVTTDVLPAREWHLRGLRDPASYCNGPRMLLDRFGAPPPPPPPLFLILLSLSVHGGAFMALAHDLWRGGRPWFYTRSKGRQLSCNHPKRPWPRRLRARAELVTRRRRRSCMPRSTRQRQRTRTREGQGG